MTSSRLDRIVCYGDSQTAGFSWGPKMVALSDTLTEAIGRGVSGQEAGSVAVRQGGIVLTTTAACTIPASTTPVIVPVQADVTPCNIRSGDSTSAMDMILGGVRGTATSLVTADVPEGMPVANRATGVFTIKFIPDSAPAEEVSVPSGTAFISQDVEDHPDWGDSLHLFWVGGNDSAYAGATRVTGIVSAAQAVVNRLRTVVDEPKFLVASRTIGKSEVEGTTGHDTAIAQRDALMAAFPDNAIDIMGHVREHGLSILGITPTAEDQAALDGGSMPPSLTSDGLHYSTATREQVLAPFIVSELAARGWTTESGEEEPTVAFTPKNDWKAGDYYEADRIIELEATVAANASAAATATSASETANSAAQGVADLREAVAAKVDALPETQKNKIYGTGADGKLYAYSYVTSGADANSIAARSSSGNIMVSTTPSVDGHATAKKYVDTAVDSAKTPAGTRAQLDAGTDTTVRAFSAKDIADYVAAQIAAAAG